MRDQGSRRTTSVIRIDEPPPLRAIIPAAQVIQLTLLIIDVPTISERIANAESICERASAAQQLTPSIVLVFYNKITSAVKDADDIALEIVVALQ